MERGVHLGRGRGLSKVGPMSQPRDTIDTESHTLDHTHAHIYAFSEPTLLCAAKGVLLSHV